jgi:serine protease inhibitor
MSKLFHGSPVQGLKNFKLMAPESEQGVQSGDAIYLTENYETAAHYANKTGSIYEVEVAGPIFDSTTPDSINDFLEYIHDETRVDLRQNPQISSVVNTVLDGLMYFTSILVMIKSLNNNEERLNLANQFGQDIYERINESATRYMRQFSGIKARINVVGGDGMSMVFIVKDPSLISVVKEHRV